jgi:tetratricopeptide (TPR) repeat protein
MTFRKVLLVLVLPLALLTAAFTLVVSRVHRNLPDARDAARDVETEAGGIAYEALQYADAERYYRHALLLSRGEGDDPLTTAFALRNLANAVAAQGRHEEAERLLLDAVARCEEARGPKSVEVLSVLGDLRGLYILADLDSLGAACEARMDAITHEVEPIFRRAVEIQESRKPPNERMVAEKKAELADLYATRGRWDLAEIGYVKALEIQERLLGKDDPVTMETLARLGEACWGLRKFTRATEIARAVLAHHEDAMGEDSPLTLEPLDRLAMLELVRGNIAAAESLHTRALRIRERVLGLHHPELTFTLRNLVTCEERAGNLEAAIETQRRAMSIDERVFGAEHRKMGLHLLRMAELEARAGILAGARTTCRKALVILTQTLGPGHETTVECRFTLDALMNPGGSGEPGSPPSRDPSPTPPPLDPDFDPETEADEIDRAA